MVSLYVIYDDGRGGAGSGCDEAYDDNKEKETYLLTFTHGIHVL